MDKKKVKDYMTYDVVSVDISGTAKDVIDKIHKTHHDGFPVVENNGVVGYISARDLLFVQPTHAGRTGDVQEPDRGRPGRWISMMLPG